MITNFFVAFLLVRSSSCTSCSPHSLKLIHPVPFCLTPLAVRSPCSPCLPPARRLHMWSGPGLLLLFGIVKKNSILQIDFVNRAATRTGLRRPPGDDRGQPSRFRPILMTTAVRSSRAMIPTALAQDRDRRPGRRSPWSSSAAVAVFPAHIASIPVLYTILDDIVTVRWRERIAHGASPRQTPKRAPDSELIHGTCEKTKYRIPAFCGVLLALRRVSLQAENRLAVESDFERLRAVIVMSIDESIFKSSEMGSSIHPIFKQRPAAGRRSMSIVRC